MFRPFCKYTKRNPFSPKFYVKNYELLPMLAIFVLDTLMFTICPIRTLLNTDCNWSRWSTAPEDRLDRLIHPRPSKFLCFNLYQPNQELYDLYQDMRTAEEEQKAAAAEELKKTEEEQKKAEEGQNKNQQEQKQEE